MKGVTITNSIGLIALAAAILVSMLTLTITWKTMNETSLAQRRVVQCLTVAKLAWQDGEQTGETIDQETFDQCMSTSVK